MLLDKQHGVSFSDKNKALLAAMNEYAPEEGEFFYMREKDGTVGIFSYWPDTLRWIRVDANQCIVRSFYAREFSEVLGKVPTWDQWEETSGELQKAEPKLNLLMHFPKDHIVDRESEVPWVLGKFLSDSYPKWVSASRSVRLLVGDRYGSGSIEVKLTAEAPRSAIGTLDLILQVREGGQIEPMEFTIYFVKEVR